MSTFISITALVISLVSLFISIRKDRNAKRLLVTEKISSLLERYNNTLRIISKIKSEILELNMYWKDCKHIDDNRANKYIADYDELEKSIQQRKRAVKSLSPDNDPVEIVKVISEAEEALSMFQSSQERLAGFFSSCPDCIKQQNETEKPRNQGETRDGEKPGRNQGQPPIYGDRKG